MILTHGANSLKRGGGNTVDIGGRKYRYVVIGTQVWLAENLDYKFSGLAIGPSGNPATPAAWYYNNNESTYGENGNKYGLLYNWFAVKYLNDNRASLCPGWHIPTTTEWATLADAVGGSLNAGTKLKSSTGWGSGNGTDDFGFSAFPAGYRASGSFNNLGEFALFWTATEFTSTQSIYTRFTSGSEMDHSYLIYNKTYAMSVRLVKDS